MPHFSATVTACLDRPLRSGHYYLAACLVSVLYTLHLFPLDFFIGTAGFWFNTHTDPTQHITGMWAFAQDQWRFPLLHTRLLNAPDGVSVAFTDSIPLAALLFRPIYAWLPAGSHYFGVWVFVCYVLQGMAGAWAAATIAGRSPAALCSGTLFALMMPALMIRIPHAALLAQCMLIVMLVLYYQLNGARVSLKYFVVRAVLLLLLSAAIHLYLLAMLYTLYGAALLDYAWRMRTRTGVARWVSLTLLPIPLLLLIFLALGFMSVSGGLPPAENGFTESSMNLLSPLLGTHLAPSGFLPTEGTVLDATGLQIDGHNYLGLALLLMLGFAAVTQPRGLLLFLRSHIPMALVLLGLVAYSLSNIIYLGGVEVLRYPLPELVEPLTRIFRGSGRFFWPVGYALLLMALGFFLRRPNPVYRLILLALVAVQYADTAPHRAYLSEAAHREPVFAYDHDLWDRRIEQASAVYLLPTYGCGAPGDDALFLQYFTALHAVPFNTGFIARVAGDCAVKGQIDSRPRVVGEVFVFKRSHYSNEQIRAAMGTSAEQWCAEEPIGVVCIVPAAG